MVAPKEPFGILPLMIGGASFVIIIAGMKASADILNSFFLAFLIAITITPFLKWLKRKGLAPWLALLVTILTVVIAGIFLVAFLGISISKLLQTLPIYQARLQVLKTVIENSLEAKGINAAEPLALDIFNPNRIIGAIAGFLLTLGQALSASLLLFFIIIFMLLESTGFPLKLQGGLAPDSQLLTRLNIFNRSIRSYIGITAWTGAVTALIDLAWLVTLGIDLAALWGVLFFLLNFIPAVGFLLAVFPPVVLALLKFGGHKAFLLFFGCWLVDNIMDKAVKPRFMQQGLDLSPLIIILSVIVWSWVLGPTGAILAVPLTLAIKQLILENFQETRLLGLMMGAGLKEAKLDNAHPK